MELNELIAAMKNLAEAMKVQAASYQVAANHHVDADDLPAADKCIFASNAWNDASKGILEVLAKAEAK